jgi:hypothetical protein
VSAEEPHPTESGQGETDRVRAPAWGFDVIHDHFTITMKTDSPSPTPFSDSVGQLGSGGPLESVSFDYGQLDIRYVPQS